jgi:hypothetical protein
MSLLNLEGGLAQPVDSKTKGDILDSSELGKKHVVGGEPRGELRAEVAA